MLNRDAPVMKAITENTKVGTKASIKAGTNATTAGIAETVVSTAATTAQTVAADFQPLNTVVLNVVASDLTELKIAITEMAG